MDEISTAYERRLQYVEEIIHDIVTPVQILEGYRQLIERHGRTESLVDEFLEAARIELKRLRDMALILKDTQREEKQKSLEWIDASEITKRIKHIQGSYIRVTPGYLIKLIFVFYK